MGVPGPELEVHRVRLGSLKQQTETPEAGLGSQKLDWDPREMEADPKGLDWGLRG